MAKMHPPSLMQSSVLGRVDGRAPSEAEILVYEAFRDRLDDTWDVFYSIWLRDTAGPLHAEADFVAVGADAILAFEVKGGIVERAAGGTWRFIPKSGARVDEKARGPVDQVRDAWYALRRHVERYCDDSMLLNRTWGYGVVTPECVLRFEGPDPGVPSALWLDQSGFPDGLPAFVKQVVSYWRQDLVRRGVPELSIKPFTASERSALERAIQPVIRCVAGVGRDVRAAEKESIRLTQEQCRALDYARLDDRLVVQGGAGTGKTLIAIVKAARESQGGKRVLFVCFNRLLADHLARDERLRHVDVSTYHQLIYRMLGRAGIEHSVPEGWDAFNRVAADFVLEAVDRLGETFEPWDYLVVDEAQDLMDESFFGALGLLVKGGLSKGRWLACLDTEQAIFSSQFDPKYFAKLSLDANARQVVLPDNCRNTRQIAAYSHGVGHVEELSRGVIEGRVPRFEYFSSDGDLRRRFRKAVNRLVAEFRDAKLDVSRIAVLIAHRDALERLVLDELTETLAEGELLRPAHQPGEGRIRVSTIQAFKGLESDAVIVLGIDDLSLDWQRKLFYVASTRARAVLEVLLPDSQQQLITDATGAVLREMLATAGDAISV
jgi:hypothetical protein